MGTSQINKLRKRFMVAAMLSFAIIIFIIGLAINLGVISINHAQARKTLDHIIETSSTEDEDVNRIQKKIMNGENSLFILNPFSLNIMSNARYFKVKYVKGGDIYVSSNGLQSLSETDITELSASILKRAGRYGTSGIYYYEKISDDDGNRIVAAIDYSDIIFNVNRLFYLTVFMGLLIFSLLYFLVRHFSKIAVRPEIENDKRQKEFITNASHELKTPLAVIKADTEYLEILNGENEWTKAIMNQADRMNGLIQNLVRIARDEEQDEGEVTEVDVDKLVNETIEPFMALAGREDKKVTMHIPSGVRLLFDGNQIRMLTSILMDNAIKYCDEKGSIEISLSQKKPGRQAVLTVSNSYKDGENVDYTKFFERFYREDKSHHIEGKSGYGIGLSVAQSICEKNHGSIQCDWKNGIITFTCILKGGR